MNRRSPMKVSIVGAGFSGLVTAFECAEVGLDVEVWEAGVSCGGLIHTVSTPWGLVETAANGFINSPLIERLARAAHVELAPTRRASRRRYIWRDGRPRRWPLGILESLTLCWRLLCASLGRQIAPRPKENVAQWGDRVLGQAAREFMLGPALQGIYAESAERLSATLLFARFRRPARERRARLLAGLPSVRLRGTVAPENGMGELVRGLEAHLRARGVKFHLHHPLSSEGLAARLKEVESEGPVVLAVNLGAAAKLLQNYDAGPSAALALVPRIGLATTTLFYKPHRDDLRGFGVLFPRGANIHAHGALFNTEIYEGRGEYRSETWILRDPPSDDRQLLEAISNDRRRLTGRKDIPIGHMTQRWSEALPVCGSQLEEWLADGHLDRWESRGLYCVGNWTGTLGLSQIALRAREIALRMREQSA